MAANVNACTCIDGSLKERFKKASAVFVGGIYDFENDEKSGIQNFQEGLPVLLVKHAWKGVHKELIAVDFEAPKYSGGTCPWFLQFKPDTDYLIFAYGKELKVKVECSDTHQLTTEYSSVNRDMSRLDSFGFKFRTKLWPF